MQASILWLTRLGIDHDVFTLKSAWAVRMKLGEDAELLDFAQELVDGGHVDHALIEHLEKLAGQALARANQGPPSHDPFDTPATRVPFSPPTTPSAHAPTPPPTPPPDVGPASTPTSRAPFATIAPFGGRDLPFESIATLPERELAAALRHFLLKTAAEGASDLHLSAGSPPLVRRERALHPLSTRTLTADDALRLNTALLTPTQRATYLAEKDLDFALALDPVHRLRVNLMFHKAGSAGSYRLVASKIPRLDDLGLRNVETVRKLLTYHNGLILVTGPVGSGKTTTLAALVAELNATRQDHVITVEDPIEIVQTSAGCNITQREVGTHTRSFASALKGALREDPDVIVIGELRDLETIEMAISASETGHLVIGTMHTSDAATTLNRLLDVFPPAQQAQIRASVSESLRGIICQRLLPAAAGGLVLACEILIGNSAVSALIREGKSASLRNVMETGLRDGMCLMDTSVLHLWSEGRITAAVARENISDRILRSRVTG